MKIIKTLNKNDYKNKNIIKLFKNKEKQIIENKKSINV